MTNIIKPESDNTKWAIVTQADRLFGSKGKKKLRADIEILSGIKVEKGKRMDKTYHLAVALMDNKIREYKANKPLIAGFREVAVKIGNTGTEDGAKDMYIIMNINSLAKRLGVDKKTIKEHEKIGDVDVFIKNTLEEMVITQKKISQILSDVNNWIDKEENFNFTDQDKEDFVKFIKKHFDDKELYRRAKNFVTLNFDPNIKCSIVEFVRMLEPKIWWDFKESAVYAKVALTQASLDIPDIKVSFCKAFEQAGHSVEEQRHLIFFESDKENKYVVRVGDYVYTKKPTSHHKDEVPLKLQDKNGADKWVLVSVRDLKNKLGLTEKEIKEADSKNNLSEKLMKNVEAIKANNDKIKKLIDTDDFLKNMQEVLENHPNQEVKNIISPLLSSCQKLLDNLDVNLTVEQKDQKRRKILFQTTHALKQKLGAIGALEGDGHIPDTFRGEALTRKRMPGKAANRYRLLDFDTKGRYAPQLREETYFTKPIDLFSNEVALRLTGSNGVEEWYVFNKSSLKRRLGLSEEELKRSEDFTVIIEKKRALEYFNARFEHDFRKKDLTVDAYRTSLDAAIRQHPDAEVREVLQEAERRLVKLEKKWLGPKPEVGYTPADPRAELNQNLPDEVNALYQKLVEMGALSQNRENNRGENFLPLDINLNASEEKFNQKLQELGISIKAAIVGASKQGIIPSYGMWTREYPRHKGSVLPRLHLVPENRDYSIAFEGKLYSERPIPHSDKEVALALRNEAGDRVAWTLVYVSSLERLGLSKKQVIETAKQDRLDQEVFSIAKEKNGLN